MRCYLTNGNPLWNFWDLKKTKITLSKNLSRDMDKIKKCSKLSSNKRT